ncbi:hypothetical protein K439DRAFT_1542548 [Ramaria rubella]|nr:hypothetical protein K439DRAFT_1542548 [Ramaria rubella]
MIDSTHAGDGLPAQRTIAPSSIEILECLQLIEVGKSQPLINLKEDVLYFLCEELCIRRPHGKKHLAHSLLKYFGENPDSLPHFIKIHQGLKSGTDSLARSSPSASLESRSETSECLASQSQYELQKPLHLIQRRSLKLKNCYRIKRFTNTA